MEDDFEPFGVPMFERVGDRLLRDPVEVSGQGVIADQDRLAVFKGASHVEKLLRPGDQLGQGGHKSVGFGADRVQTARQGPGV